MHNLKLSRSENTSWVQVSLIGRFCANPPAVILLPNNIIRNLFLSVSPEAPSHAELTSQRVLIHHANAKDHLIQIMSKPGEEDGRSAEEDGQKEMRKTTETGW